MPHAPKHHDANAEGCLPSGCLVALLVLAGVAALAVYVYAQTRG